MRAQNYLILALAVLFTACGTVLLTSIPALSRIDFRTIDFSAVRAGLRLPEALRPQPEGVELEVTLRISGSLDEKSMFPLVGISAGSLPDGEQLGKRDFVYRLSDQDSRRLDAIHDKTTAARQQNRRGSVELSITPRQFCFPSPLPDGPVLVTTYIQTSETNRFVVLTRDLDLRAEPQIAANLSNVKACKDG